MTTYTLDGKPFEFDETQTYLDFFLEGDRRYLVPVPFAETLAVLQNGTVTFDLVEMEMVLLDRWLREAPRKRFYRGLKLSGAHVLSDEYWFEDRDDGDAIIDALERSGQVARRLLEHCSPATAFACAQNPHPASVNYIDP